MGFFSAISIIGSVIGAIKDAWNRYQRRKEVEFETELAIERGKQLIIEKEIEFGHKISLAQLKSTPRWFKIFTFMAWFAPYLAIVFIPEYGVMMFKNLELAPLWYVQTMQVLLFAVWGIAVSRDTIAGVFNNISSNWQSRKIQKEVVKEVVKEAKKRYNRTELKTAVTKHFNLKTEEELDRFEKVFKELDK